jgi:Phage Mu protein F like protein.
VSVTEGTLRLVRKLRSDVDKLADNLVRLLTRAWVGAWSGIKGLFVAAIDAVIGLAQSGEGRWPARGTIFRARAVQKAVNSAEKALDRLTGVVRREAGDAAATAIRAAVEAQAEIVASQLPSGKITAGIVWDRLDVNAVHWMINRTREQIHARTWPLSRDAVEAMRTELVRGVVRGTNPRDVAAEMLKRVEGAFNGGLARATNIARTEMVDSSRAAAQAAQDANADTLRGWRWSCTLSPRTCPSCLAMNGTVHPLSEPGPQDHQSGRCARVPLTKTWRDLGIDLDEPPDDFPDARAWFNNLPDTDRVTIMGPRRLEMLDQGEIAWEDLPVRRDNPEWRPAWYVRPVRDLETVAKRRATI